MGASAIWPRADRRLAVWPIDRGEPQRIVVGLDDADCSRRTALGRQPGQAHRCHRTCGTRDRLADRHRGVRVDRGRRGRSTAGGEGERPVLARMRRAFEEASPEPGWQLQFAEGDAGAVLVAEAANADLLVIGTRTNPDWTGDVSGPVAHHCLSRMTCLVVAVPLESHGLRSVSDF